MDDQQIIQVPKYSVKLIKNTKGYNWEISVRDDMPGVVVQWIERLDKEMRQKYGDPDS